MTIHALRQSLHNALAQTDAAAFDVMQILMHTCQLTRLDITAYADKEVDEAFARQALALAHRRAKGEPLQYLLGTWEFYSLPFEVGQGVLIPRADTELLVDTALQALTGQASPVIVDLCSGSGCVAIALAKHIPSAKLYAVELSTDAAYYLVRNANSNQVDVKLIQADACKDSTAARLPQLDAVVVNPPYLTQEDMQRLQTEVSHEPQLALFGGEDGLDFYRILIELWAKKLRSGGLFACEIGQGQDEAVMQIMQKAKLKNIQGKKDINGTVRVIYGDKQ